MPKVDFHPDTSSNNGPPSRNSEFKPITSNQSFGALCRLVTGNRVLLHPEERVGFCPPKAGTTGWYGHDDPANPQNWSLPKKGWVTFVILYYTMAIYAGSAIVAYAFHDMSEYFGVSEIIATLTLTLFVLGYAIGPLFLSPLSEIPSIGRNPPYVVTFAIFTLLQIPSALSTNFAGLAVLRFLAGVMGSPPLATGGASLTDIYSPRKSGYAMGAYGVAVGIAPAVAPLLSGFAVMNHGWRWAFWVLMILAAAGLVFLFFGLPEVSRA